MFRLISKLLLCGMCTSQNDSMEATFHYGSYPVIEQQVGEALPYSSFDDEKDEHKDGEYLLVYRGEDILEEKADSET